MNWINRDEKMPTEKGRYFVMIDQNDGSELKPSISKFNGDKFHFDMNHIAFKVKYWCNIDNPEVGSKELIGNVNEVFENLKHKEFDWTSFYNGWIEGRAANLTNKYIPTTVKC